MAQQHPASSASPAPPSASPSHRTRGTSFQHKNLYSFCAENRAQQHHQHHQHQQHHQQQPQHAATCSHLQPLAAACSHWQPLAAACSHLQPLEWLRSCKWFFSLPQRMALVDDAEGAGDFDGAGGFAEPCFQPKNHQATNPTHQLGGS